jgi:hypothetical protein
MWLAVAVAAVVGAGGAALWFATPAPPEGPPEEQSYADIERAEYERWMQSLGYTQ